MAKRRDREHRAREAKERLAGHIPSPNYAYIASDPLKSRVVAVAIRRLYSASEFARDADIPMTTATAVFKALREKGILELVEEVQVRGAIKHLYRATEAAFVGEGDWEQMADALRAVFSGSIVHDFNVRATQAIETGHLFSRDDICIYWAPRDLDEIAWREQAEIAVRVIEESVRLEEDTARRRANGESEGSFHSTFAIAAFPSPTYDEFQERQRKTTSTKSKRKPKKEKSGKKSTRKGKAKRRRKGEDDKT